MTEQVQKKTSSDARRARYTARAVQVEIVPLSARAPREVSAVRGYMTVTKDGPLIPFESDLERRFLVLARLEPRIVAVRAQPFALEFTDASSGFRRRYTPDFLVQFAASAGLPFPELLVEIKARRDLFRERRRLRGPFAAAQIWASEASGRAFRIITDVHMAVGAWSQNAELLAAHLDKRYEPAFLGLCLDLFEGDREAQLQAILERAQQQNLNHTAVLSALYHLMAHRILDVELGVAIGYSTWLRLNESSQERSQS